MPALNFDLHASRLREADTQSIQEHLNRVNPPRYGRAMGLRLVSDHYSENTKRFYLPYALRNLLDASDDLEARK